jgi:hypothetical protein
MHIGTPDKTAAAYKTIRHFAGDLVIHINTAIAESAESVGRRRHQQNSKV